MSFTQDLSFQHLSSNNKLVGTENLKILIVSTPKTGNTWLRYLLSAIYDLPMVDINRENIDKINLKNLSPRWVSQEHFYPNNGFLSWARQNQITLITTIRHPGDVLVSFYHYLHNFTEQFHKANTISYYSALVEDTKDSEKEYVNALAQFVSKDFMFDLNVSVSWIRLKQSFVVRYEDLWRDPKYTLLELTSKIHSVEEDCIERAIDRCTINP